MEAIEFTHCIHELVKYSVLKAGTDASVYRQTKQKYMNQDQGKGADKVRLSIKYMNQDGQEQDEKTSKSIKTIENQQT